MKLIYKYHSTILLSVLFLLSLSSSVFARQKRHEGPYSSMFMTHTKQQRHFDIDDDGYLNRYEYSLYNTYTLFHYPLVKKKKQVPYDFNHDLMLQPFELQMYLRDKKNGRLVKVVKHKKQKKSRADKKKRR